VRKKLSFLIVVAVSFILSAQPLYVRADDGGDGGSGTGGSGDGSGTGGSGDGSGTDSGTGTDSTGTGGTGNGGTDSTGADDASNGDATTANDAPDAPSTDPSAVAEAPTSTDPSLAQTLDETALSVNNTVSPLDAIQAEATTDPRGGFLPVNQAGTGSPGTASVLLPGGAPVDVAINAVIVSAAQSPWDAITKADGVRNVIVTGGIVALGKTPIDGEIPGGGPQPLWLRLIPDLRLLNGSAIPPVVPNVIDIRILNFPIKTIDPDGEQVE
jgi:hypothetical protein